VPSIRRTFLSRRVARALLELPGHSTSIEEVAGRVGGGKVEDSRRLCGLSEFYRASLPRPTWIFVVIGSSSLFAE